MGAKSFLQAGQRREIFGFLLIVLAVFFFISLATYHSGDFEKLTSDSEYFQGPGISEGGAGGVQPATGNSITDLLNVEVDNSAGIVGAWTSYHILTGIGRSAYLILLVLVVIGWQFLFQAQITRLRNKLLQAFGFIFILGSLIWLFQLDQPSIAAQAPQSLSGLAGLTLAGLIHALFGVTGGFAVLGAALLFLFFAIVPFKVQSYRSAFVVCWQWCLRNGRSAGHYLVNQTQEWKASLQTIFRKDDLEDEAEDEPEPAPEPVVRIPRPERGRREATSESDQLPLELDEERERRKLRISRSAKKSKDGYVFPPLDLIQPPPRQEPGITSSDLDSTARSLEETLDTFNIDIVPNSLQTYPGPIITRFEFKPAPGIKINQIVNLADDLALALKASRVRIIAPVPGKSAVGVEIPNRRPQQVYIREILESREYQTRDRQLPLALGKTTAGEPYVTDLAKMPHLLIAGSTGSGKSVCLNAIITSLIYRHTPRLLRFIFIDPKILELSIYADFPFLARPVVTRAKMAESVLATAVNEMEERYRKLASESVRSLADYNNKVADEDRLPYLLIVVDELADMMMSSSSKKVELLITRLAQMARAVGIHLILATQRPSVDVITGLIKANFSSRIAFQVASKVDSRTILDCNGAEKLLGSGDMLLLLAGAPEPVRLHGAWISSQESEDIVSFLKENAAEASPLQSFTEERERLVVERSNNDVLLPEATELVIRHKQGSVSLLQRRLGIGYQRAARIMDQLEASGIVGPYDGSRAREVLVDKSYLEELRKDKPSA